MLFEFIIFRFDLEPINTPMHTAVVCSFKAQRSVDIFYKCFWGIIPMRSIRTYKLVPKWVQSKAIPNTCD